MKFFEMGDVMKEINTYELLFNEENLNIDILEPILTELVKELLLHIEEGKKSSMLSSILKHYEDCVDMMEDLNVLNNQILMKVFMLGYLNSIFKTEKLKLEEEKNIERWNSSEYNYKNLDKFIDLLYHENQVSKKNVMEKLNIKQSAMSNFYAKTEKLNLYKSKKYGNEVYYVITREGRDYYRFCVKQKQSLISTVRKENEYILKLLDSIIKEKQYSGTEKSGWHVVEVFEEETNVRLLNSKKIEHKIDLILDSDECSYSRFKSSYSMDDDSDFKDSYCLKYK